MSCVLLSLKVPVAVNCFVVPTAMLEFAGVTAMETSVATRATSWITTPGTSARSASAFAASTRVAIDEPYFASARIATAICSAVLPPPNTISGIPVRSSR